MKNCIAVMLLVLGTVACGGKNNDSNHPIPNIPQAQPQPVNPQPVPVGCVDYSGNYQSPSFFVTVTQKTCDQVELRYFDLSPSKNQIACNTYTRNGLAKREVTSDNMFEERELFQILLNKLVFTKITRSYLPDAGFSTVVRETLLKNNDGSISSSVVVMDSRRPQALSNIARWKKI